MKLGFVIFKYFPYGGLQSDFLRIATECVRRGHEATVYTRSWEGPAPSGIQVKLITTRAMTNHGKAVDFSRRIQRERAIDQPDGLIGFNRMPGLDLYFAGDNCLAERAATEKSLLYRVCSPRFRTYHALERAVFAPEAATRIMLLTERQKSDYVKHYGTQTERFFLLPPGIPETRRLTSEASAAGARIRRESGIGETELLLLQVGSGFVTKGVDRSIRALAALPEPLRARARLWIAGRDSRRKFVRLARQLRLEERVVFLGGCDNVPELMSAADLLIHPAVNECTGTVLIEALAAGLPVLCSGACGYATYIEQSGAGRVVSEPFSQAELNKTLAALFDRDLTELGEKGLRFTAGIDIYGRHRLAADIIEQTLDRRD